MAIQILSAHYGIHDTISSPGSIVDVISQVQNLVNGKTSVDIKADFSTFGIPDPAPGVRKSLTVSYTTTKGGSQVFFRSAVDGHSVTVIEGAPVIINSAFLSSDKGPGVDVTAFVQSWFSDPGSANYPLGTNDFNFFDIAFGITKSLFVEGTLSGGGKYQVIIQDGEQLTRGDEQGGSGTFLTKV